MVGVRVKILAILTLTPGFAGISALTPWVYNMTGGYYPLFVIPGLTRNPVDYKIPYNECFFDWIPGQARNDEL